jgi:hypothetical protein
MARRVLLVGFDGAVCEGRDLLRLEVENPFASERSRPEHVRFVSVLPKATRCPASMPVALPPRGQSLVRVLALSAIGTPSSPSSASCNPLTQEALDDCDHARDPSPDGNRRWDRHLLSRSRRA